MDNYPLMYEYFRLRAEKRRLADEFRGLITPIQERIRELESQIEGGCDSNCATCPSQVEHAPLTASLPKGRILN